MDSEPADIPAAVHRSLAAAGRNPAAALADTLAADRAADTLPVVAAADRRLVAVAHHTAAHHTVAKAGRNPAAAGSPADLADLADLADRAADNHLDEAARRTPADHRVADSHLVVAAADRTLVGERPPEVDTVVGQVRPVVHRSPAVAAAENPAAGRSQRPGSSCCRAAERLRVVRLDAAPAGSAARRSQTWSSRVLERRPAVRLPASAASAGRRCHTPERS